MKIDRGDGLLRVFMIKTVSPSCYHMLLVTVALFLVRPPAESSLLLSMADQPAAPSSPLRLAVGSTNPSKINAVKAAFTELFPDATLSVEAFSVESGVADQVRVQIGAPAS